MFLNIKLYHNLPICIYNVKKKNLDKKCKKLNNKSNFKNKYVKQIIIYVNKTYKLQLVVQSVIFIGSQAWQQQIIHLLLTFARP
jgi:hypothetical protein